MFLSRSRPGFNADADTGGRRRLSRSGWAAVGAAIAVAVGGGGIWRASASGAENSPAAFVPVTPCRLFDTREAPHTVGVRSTPLGPSETASFQVRGTNGNCTLPNDLQAVVMNVTATGMDKTSYLTVYPAGVDKPTTSSVNWNAGEQAIANAVTSAVSGTGEISIFNNAGTTNVVADVVGYYTSVNFGNYYTKQEVQQLIAANAGAIGPVGPAGPTGAAGPSGKNGSDGNNGVDGATGAVGPQGQPGTPGLQGPQGPQGLQGLVGPAGAAGDSVLSTLSCTSNQVIRFVGGVWACSNDSDILAGLHCTANQSPGFDGTNWVCRSAPIVSTLSRRAFSPPCCGVSSLFAAHSPNVQDGGFCSDFNCQIRLIDVLDHTGCSVAFTGNSRETNVLVTVTPTYIELDNIFAADPSQPLYVTITCVT